MNDEIKAHLKAGEEWSQEVILSLRSRNLWLCFVTGISLALAIACVVAIQAMLPLKTVEPYVIEVDKVTGESKVLKQYTGTIESTSIEEVLSKYWLNKYLIARESFNPKIDLEENYSQVESLSEPAAFMPYSNKFKDGAPGNPFSKYGVNHARVVVKTISFLRKDTATVRYELIEESSTGDVLKSTKWLDIITYKYTKTPATEKEALANPLGFKVIEYRTDAEVVN